MLKQYKLRELNKTPKLHKEVFVLASDAMALLEQFIEAAVEAGIDQDKLMQMVGYVREDKPTHH